LVSSALETLLLLSFNDCAGSMHRAIAMRCLHGPEVN
jgi:hypothetical protein